MRQMSIDIGQQIFDQMVSIMSDRFYSPTTMKCEWSQPLLLHSFSVGFFSHFY